MNAELCARAFSRAIDDYHQHDDVDHAENNPYPDGSPEALLYHKCWIDTVQWHLEDLARDPAASAETMADLKRRIDRSNQRRTDTVEQIDDRFLEQFRGIEPKQEARLNSETPAWLIDRLSILFLKIYHMREQTERADVDEAHRQTCRQKLEVLLEQERDLKRCLDELIEDIQAGRRYMKVYRQMKMYNDASLNPVLYASRANQTR
ncbi:MAG: DUF4254 domain-containing protein [Spirochaetales bacterium]|nr:DUF4254 domain-containing protein [Leptospiraceae bacterium]MCP5480823.1 DUF4254 domain-containing protein [Spirochaetales bacterium]